VEAHAAELETCELAPSRSLGACWESHAFGLALRSNFEIVGMPSATQGLPARSVELRRESPLDLRRITWAGTPRLVAEMRGQDGLVGARIEHDPSAGFLIQDDLLGSYLLSTDGRVVRCFPGPVEPWRWQRFLIAQVLPFTAVVRGMETIHASAVALGDRAVAFVGPSGAGKTSLSTLLMLRGARLITDDVVAMEPDGSRMRMAPGAPLINLRRSEAARLGAHDRERLGRIVGADQESLRLVVRRDPRPLPVSAVYFLERSATGTESEIAPLAAPDPRLLLTSTFHLVEVGFARQTRHLDAWARLAHSAALFRVRIPPATSAAELAELVEAHALGIPAP
jgi:hypothetical protein